MGVLGVSLKAGPDHGFRATSASCSLPIFRVLLLGLSKMSIPSTTHRTLSVFLVSLVILLLLHCAVHAGSLRVPIQNVGDGAASAYQEKRPSSPAPSLGKLVSELYKPIKLPTTATNYTDPQGKTYDNGGQTHWKKPMGHDIVIVDIDTRIPKGENGVFNPDRMDWTAVQSWGPGLLSVAHMNHFLYGKLPVPYPVRVSLFDEWLFGVDTSQSTNPRL